MLDPKYSNAFISKMLAKVAAAYEVLGEDRFRIKAYQNAASSVEHATSELKDLYEEGKLKEVPGIGSSLEAHLVEYFKTGKVKHFDEVLAKMPKGMFGLFGLQGIGSKTAHKLAVELRLTSDETALVEVKKAARENRIQVIEGFGLKKEQDILEAIEALKPNKETRQRLLLPDATEIAERYKAYMLKCAAVGQIEVLGSLRRRVATIGDIDFAVSTSDPEAVLGHFVKFAEVGEVLNEGDIKASVILNNGARVDLMTQPTKSFGSLLQHFTGSKLHNVALRKYALTKGLSLSEHGIKVNGKLHEFSSEADFYNFIGYKLIPPELREDSDELDVFLQEEGKKETPKLVELTDIRGDLHTHTDFSDGEATLQEMVQAATNMGYEYYGVTDHAPSVKTRGEAEVLRLVKQQKQNIEQLNSSNNKLRVLFGYEVNILSDASISLPDTILHELDYAIGSIHTSFDQSKELITKRLINALNNPYIKILAHPTGRLLNQRDGYDADWEAVFKVALEKNKIIEINSHPERLDLPDLLVKEAVKKGVKLIINTDAHSIEDLRLMRYGIDVAKRGWVESVNVVNTLPLKDFLKVILTK